MRTTVDIPDTLYRQLKAEAATQGRSVKDLILSSVQEELRGRQPKPSQRVKLPIVTSKRRGTLHLDNAGIYQVIPFP